MLDSLINWLLSIKTYKCIHLYSIYFNYQREEKVKIWIMNKINPFDKILLI